MTKLEQIPQLLHGGDYNPDQWLDRPDILEEDLRLMREAGVNVVTLAVFAWSSLEPEEGIYTFEWLDDIMDRLHENGIYVILSTPSGGKPPWLAQKYPEVMRTGPDRVRLLYGDRENQCNSSPIFREKLCAIDDALARRYANHPALILWHISNELYGACHCEDCQANFRRWLQAKYGTLDALNKQYWSNFWSHRYSDWEQLESPAPHGEGSLHALALDYARFYSDLTIDLVRMEIETVRQYNPDMPATTNMFHLDCGVDYAKLAQAVDVTCWDSYPRWHCGQDKTTEWLEAIKAAFTFDYCRTHKQKPFLLMESVPSVPGQFEVCKLKRPGMHRLSALQAVALGSDSVQYFQWRKGRGAYEKFHGAVLSHGGGGDTRVFRDVREVGETLRAMPDLKGTVIHSEVALLMDWDNLRALKGQMSLKRHQKDFEAVLMEHYDALRRNYVSVDVISRDVDFSRYKLIVAPMQYLYGDDTAGKIRAFVASGGRYVTTYYSGLVNENDLAYQGFAPHDLNDVFGLSAEETDSLCADEHNEVVYAGKRYAAVDCCDLLRDVSAKTLASFQHDFYTGYPALTRNRYGRGDAYYFAFRSQDGFLRALYQKIIADCGIKRDTDAGYVSDVMVAARGARTFLMNFSTRERSITHCGQDYTLQGYEVKVVG